MVLPSVDPQWWPPSCSAGEFRCHRSLQVSHCCVFCLVFCHCSFIESLPPSCHGSCKLSTHPHVSFLNCKVWWIHVHWVQPIWDNCHLNLNRKKYILKDGRNRCLPLLGWREGCWGTPFSDLGSRALSSRGPCRFSLRNEDSSPGTTVHEIHTFLGVWSPVHGCYVSELLLGCGRNQWNPWGNKETKQNNMPWYIFLFF